MPLSIGRPYGNLSQLFQQHLQRFSPSFPVQQAVDAGQVPRRFAQSDATNDLVGNMMLRKPAGRPVGVADGMGMKPPPKTVFNPALDQLTRAGGAGAGGGLSFARRRADGIMRKYGLGGTL